MRARPTERVEKGARHGRREVRDRMLHRELVHDRRVTRRTLRELIDQYPEPGRLAHVCD